MKTNEVLNLLINATLLTDGYKLGHKNFYAKRMTRLYSSFIPRSNKHFPEADEGVVVFGIQYFIKKILIDAFNRDFFNRPLEDVISEYRALLEDFVGKEVADMIGTEHIEELHKLGHLPIKVKALKEGTKCPIGVPVLTIVNTHDNFAWLTNYLESIISNECWLPMTSATTSDIYMRELLRHAKKTGFYNPYDTSNLAFLCHDFSMRGMQGLDSTIASGMAHLTSFSGSESIPAIVACNYYYTSRKGGVAGTVPATEHSVMCSNIMEVVEQLREGQWSTEVKKYFNLPEYDIDFVNSNTEETLMGCAEYIIIKRLITEIIPSGFVSIVCDSFDYWRVLTVILPLLKEDILRRNGRVVVRPDSGDPCDIICGDAKATTEWEKKGSYRILDELFGSTVNNRGFKELNPHIGLLYGDSINIARQKKIYARLEDMGYCASNLVLGIGSYTYVYQTRDSLGFAMKGNWCVVDGRAIEIFKDPKTVKGMPKKSLRGLIRVDWVDPNNHSKGICAYDRQTIEQENEGFLHTVFEDGKLLVDYSIDDIRFNLNQNREGILNYA